MEQDGILYKIQYYHYFFIETIVELGSPPPPPPPPPLLLSTNNCQHVTKGKQSNETAYSIYQDRDVAEARLPNHVGNLPLLSLENNSSLDDEQSQREQMV